VRDVADKPRGFGKSCVAVTLQVCFAFLIPFFLPKLVADITPVSWGFDSVESKHDHVDLSRYADLHALPAKYGRDTSEMIAGNAQIDIPRLFAYLSEYQRVATLNASWANMTSNHTMASNAIFMSGQTFQDSLNDAISMGDWQIPISVMFGLASVVLTWLLYFFGQNYRLVSYSEWLTYDPRFKYTHTYLCGAPLYQLVPCAFTAIGWSFSIIAVWYTWDSLEISLAWQSEFPFVRNAKNWATQEQVVYRIIPAIGRRISILVVAKVAFTKVYFDFAKQYYYSFLGTEEGLLYQRRVFELSNSGVFADCIDPNNGFELKVIEREVMEALADQAGVLVEKWLTLMSMQHAGYWRLAAKYRDCLLHSDYDGARQVRTLFSTNLLKPEELEEEKSRQIKKQVREQKVSDTTGTYELLEATAKVVGAQHMYVKTCPLNRVVVLQSGLAGLQYTIHLHEDVHGVWLAENAVECELDPAKAFAFAGYTSAGYSGQMGSLSSMQGGY